MPRHRLLIFLLLLCLTTMPVQAVQFDCFEVLTDDCIVTGAVAAGTVLIVLMEAVSPMPRGFVPPDGAGEVMAAVDNPTKCTLTPSTGQGSGVFIRALPSIESDIVGDIAPR